MWNTICIVGLLVAAGPNGPADTGPLKVVALQSTEQGLLDLPDIALEGRNRDEATQDAPRAVKRAVRKATRGVQRCYARALRHQNVGSGSIVAQFTITPKGRVRQIAIVDSDLTASLGRCVKQVIRKTRFNRRTTPLEVTAPWTFQT